jgi:uncharacterized membrane protein YphA (DoxX/SURF4 family)
MKKLLSNSIFLLLLRLILGFIFIYAGGEKISYPDKFAESIANYQLLNNFFITLTAVVLPWIEVFAGILLICGAAVKENSVILSSLLFIFIAVGIISLLRGLDIDCGCFGSTTVKLGLTKILENVLLLATGIILIIFGSGKYAINKME